MVAAPTLGGRWAVERTRPRHRWKASRRRPGHAAGRRSTCQPKTLPGPGCLCPYCWTRPANSKWPRPPRGGAMLCSARIGGAGSRSCAARPLSRWTRPAQPYHCTRLWMRGPCNGGPTKRLKACGATRLAASRSLWRAARPRMATCWRPSRKRCCSCTAEPASLRRLQERRTLQVREPTSPAECRALDQRELSAASAALTAMPMAPASLEASADLLLRAAERLANADVPADVLAGVRLGRMVGLRKPDGGVRGLVMSDAFRRLVASAEAFLHRIAQGRALASPAAQRTAVAAAYRRRWGQMLAVAAQGRRWRRVRQRAA